MPIYLPIDIHVTGRYSAFLENTTIGKNTAIKPI
jgi:hypothetical protein